MRTAGFCILGYTAVRPVTFLRLSLECFRWSTGCSRGHEDHHLPGPLAPGSEGTIGATTYQFKRRTISPDIVQRSFGTAAIFRLTFLVGLLGICLVTPDDQRLFGLWWYPLLAT